MSEDLFPVEESLSPRAKWARDAGVQTHRSNIADIPEPWCAWLPDNEECGIPVNPDACGFGVTEQEAIDSLALRHGALTWSTS
jgi:hypothetical protein